MRSVLLGVKACFSRGGSWLHLHAVAEEVPETTFAHRERIFMPAFTNCMSNNE